MSVPNYDVSVASKLVHTFVPISRFNRGEAGKIIDEVKEDGIRIVIKNNIPECVMITMDEYDHLKFLQSHPLGSEITPEEEEKRKAFIKKIRENVPPPIPAKTSPEERRKIMDEIGPIYVDEEAVNELRRLG